MLGANFSTTLNVPSISSCNGGYAGLTNDLFDIRGWEINWLLHIAINSAERCIVRKNSMMQDLGNCGTQHSYVDCHMHRGCRGPPIGSHVSSLPLVQAVLDLYHPMDRNRETIDAFAEMTRFCRFFFLSNSLKARRASRKALHFGMLRHILSTVGHERPCHDASQRINVHLSWITVPQLELPRFLEQPKLT